MNTRQYINCYYRIANPFFPIVKTMNCAAAPTSIRSVAKADARIISIQLTSVCNE